MTSRNDNYWKRHVRKYNRATGLLNHRFSEVVQACEDAVGNPDHVLEIAAGTGLITEAIVPHAKRYTVTDATPEMLEVLHQRFGHDARVVVQNANALDLGYPDASFDVVIMANLLHLLDNPKRALAESARVLQPGGRLVVPTFGHGQGMVAQLVSRMLGLTGFPVVTRFRGCQLDNMVAGVGFELVEARWISGVLPVRFLVACKPLV
jgi:phosphatidylethanolamine/phosphatidyl-N-methylethanolamine N-methyltransferase